MYQWVSYQPLRLVLRRLLHCADSLVLFEVYGCGGCGELTRRSQIFLRVATSEVRVFLLRVMLCLMLEAADCVHLMLLCRLVQVCEGQFLFSSHFCTVSIFNSMCFILSGPRRLRSVKFKSCVAVHSSGTVLYCHSFKSRAALKPSIPSGAAVLLFLVQVACAK